MRRILGLFATCTLLLCMSPVVADASAISFGPTPYLQMGDTPAAFYCALCVDPLVIENFEDNSLDPFLSIDNGRILEPNSTSGTEGVSTDSVDGDDGSVDGCRRTYHRARCQAAGACSKSGNISDTTQEARDSDRDYRIVILICHCQAGVDNHLARPLVITATGPPGIEYSSSFPIPE